MKAWSQIQKLQSRRDKWLEGHEAEAVNEDSGDTNTPDHRDVSTNKFSVKYPEIPSPRNPSFDPNAVSAAVMKAFFEDLI